jgi:hypothetical protein
MLIVCCVILLAAVTTRRVLPRLQLQRLLQCARKAGGGVPGAAAHPAKRAHGLQLKGAAIDYSTMLPVK